VVVKDLPIHWIAFTLVKGIGAVRFRALLDFFGTAEMAWNAPIDGLRQAGLSAKIIENLLKVRSQVSLEQVAERITRQGISVLTWDDETYPRRLKTIDQPPPVLYLRGSLTLEDEWAVAVVGTRRITAYGRQVTEELAGTLARSGVTVVSGLARGVDAVAHQSALKAGGRTIAVLGSGVDRIYPPEHERLAAQIAEAGAVISDYVPGTPPDAQNFPPRNRIISGLSMCVVVTEAGETSGALITTQFAAEQGREVFAVPGSILSPNSRGPNRLIRDGARPMLSAQDVLESLNMELVVEHRTARTTLPTDPIEAQLYQALGPEPLHVDELRSQTNLPIEKVTAALTMMELKGLARQMGGMSYVRVREEQGEYQVNAEKQM
jgi:DNA processing protein